MDSNRRYGKQWGRGRQQALNVIDHMAIQYSNEPSLFPYKSIADPLILLLMVMTLCENSTHS